MQSTKWIFLGFAVFVALLITALGFSYALTPARDRDVLYLANRSHIKTLDIAELSDAEGALIVGNVVETLYNYEYGVRPYKLFPQLAAEMPRISEDGKTWTIKLRRGIHFYDPLGVVDGWMPIAGDRGRKGPEVKAKDWIYSWKRVCNFQLGVTANYSAIFESRFEGLDDWWEHTKSAATGAIDWDRPIAGMRAVDDYTIELRLTQPYPQLIYNLAHMPTAVLSREAIETSKLNARQYPIGTGAYAIADHQREQRVTLVANPIYRGRPDVDGNTPVSESERLPRIRQIQMDYLAVDVSRWIAFRQGLLDRIERTPKEAFGKPDVPLEELEKRVEQNGRVLMKDAEPTLFYYGFNMLDPVLGKNLPLRQAICLAMDRQKYIDVYLLGRGMVPNGVIPPGMPTYDPDRVHLYSQYNVELAREKMAEARRIYGGAIPRLRLNIERTDTVGRQRGEFFASQMAQIGLEIDAQYNTWSHHQELIDEKNVQIFSFGWTADYPDEQSFLQLFYGKNAQRGGVNSSNYVNPEFDGLFEKASVMSPGPARDELYRRMQEMINADCPWLYAYYHVEYVTRYDWLKGVHNMDYGNGRAMWKMYATLDSEKRRKWFERRE